ncbi:MAG: DNA polymerase III subunit delta [Pseudomonadota bacterium]
MGAVKAHEADRLLASAKAPPAPVCLIYGPDRGLVTERIQRIATLSGVDINDPFASAALMGADVTGNNVSRLMDEVYTASMFGGGRLVKVSDAANDPKFVDAIRQICADVPTDVTVLLEAGDLKKSAGLRTAIERASNAIAIPCYSDDAKSLQTLIDASMNDIGARLSLDARHYLVAQLGGDRQTTRQELKKLATFATGKDEIDVDDVTAIIGDTAALSLDAVVDGVISGNLTACETALARLEAAGRSPVLLFSALTRQFQQLENLRSAIEQDGKSARAAVEGARPPVFFSRKSLVTQALQTWSGDMIRAALRRIQDAVLSSRQRGSLEASIARMTVLALATQAARRRA